MTHVSVIDHPLISDKLTRLRDKDAPFFTFRNLVREIATILAVQSSFHCSLKETPVETPLESTAGKILAREIVIVPILRAGLGMVEGFLSIFPGAKISFLGVYRDEETLKPVAYYKNIQASVGEAEIFLLDPMLATGGSAEYCLSLIKKHGGKNITLVTIISAPEGIAHIHETHPDVRIVTACVDRELNDDGYILPGLGDAGDRLNGTI
ncbi:MAG: uracil phosphoribosyltransferase [Candidatus Zhuqueibacterota bacterium]